MTENVTTSRPETYVTRGEEAAIEIKNLVVGYGKKQVLDGLNLTVPAGSIFGFLGANGTGKTTTIKTLLGFRAPTSGTVRVLGYDSVSQHVDICERIGYVSETSSLYNGMSISQICAFCRSMQTSWNQQHVDHYLSLFALPQREKVGRLSKGMKAQLALCLALGNNPDLLILDEPTAGLDPVARQLFLKILVNEIAVAGKTIFFSSHILSEIEAIADHVAVLREGRVVLNDEMDQLRAAHKLLRLVFMHTPPAQELQMLTSLPQVMRINQEGRTVQLHVHGDAQAVQAAIEQRPYTLLDSELLPVKLEDVLMDAMKGENNVH